MPLVPADPRVLESWPAELAALPFGSPEFKAANARLAAEDEARCSPFARAMPTWINLTSTTVCNLKCFMCNQFLDPNSPKEMMDEDVYDKIVRELYPYAKTMQLSAFGEPLMTPRMEQKLDDLDRYGMKLEMVTNATLMMKESKFREKLLRCLELVTFSMELGSGFAGSAGTSVTGSGFVRSGKRSPAQGLPKAAAKALTVSRSSGVADRVNLISNICYSGLRVITV